MIKSLFTQMINNYNNLEEISNKKQHLVSHVVN